MSVHDIALLTNIYIVSGVCANYSDEARQVARQAIVRVTVVRLGIVGDVERSDLVSSDQLVDNASRWAGRRIVKYDRLLGRWAAASNRELRRTMWRDGSANQRWKHWGRSPT